MLFHTFIMKIHLIFWLSF